jgi:hypothetical protein
MLYWGGGLFGLIDQTTQGLQHLVNLLFHFMHPIISYALKPLEFFYAIYLGPVLEHL